MKSEIAIYILAGVVLACLILRYWKGFTRRFKNTLAWEILTFIPKLIHEFFDRMRYEFRMKQIYRTHKYEAPAQSSQHKYLITSPQQGYEEFKKYRK